MQIVIKMPEGDYINLKNAINSLIANGVERDSMSKLCLAVLDGTPLPKGHGDLKDVNALKHAFIAWSMAVHGNFTDADIASIIYNSQTIIGADTESKI